MSIRRHPIWDICGELNSLLRNFNNSHNYEVKPCNKDYFYIFKRVKDNRCKFGYRLQAIVKLSSFETAKEYILLNLIN